MFRTSRQTLRWLAAVLWCSGVVVLFTKSAHLLLAAQDLYPVGNWTWLAGLSGLVFGGIKARFLFSKICFRNLERIHSLENPRIWNFYRLRFFAFLLAMVVLGRVLSQLSEGHYPALLAMAFVEISVGTALLGSSYCFWTERRAPTRRAEANADETCP